MQLLIDEQFLLVASELIQKAKRNVFISTYKAEISPKPRGRRLRSLFDLLVLKARLGLDVRLYLNKLGDNWWVPRSNFTAVNALRSSKIQIRTPSGGRNCHAKIILIDNIVAIVGSHNLSITSCHRNFEVSCGVVDLNAVDLLYSTYEKVWSEGKKG